MSAIEQPELHAPFPVPVPDADTEAFWEAARERRLVVPRCATCGKRIWQPKPVCPRCHAPDPEWVEESGAGRIASWTVIHPPVLPAFADAVPFVILLVELDGPDGPVRMVGQLVDHTGALVSGPDADAGVVMGAPVVLRWREQGGWVIPAWGLPPAP